MATSTSVCKSKTEVENCKFLYLRNAIILLLQAEVDVARCRHSPPIFLSRVTSKTYNLLLEIRWYNYVLRRYNYTSGLRPPSWICKRKLISPNVDTRFLSRATLKTYNLPLEFRWYDCTRYEDTSDFSIASLELFPQELVFGGW
jgi:hypothetical protein